MKDKKRNLADIRYDYDKDSLHKKDLMKNPIDQFMKWFELALEKDIIEANSMTLATADSTGTPAARVVLLKGVEDGGFVFFTNYESRKAMEIKENPKACLLFFWKDLQCQVRIDGVVEKIPEEQSTEYFQSRPKGSQISATASAQSKVIESKERLEKRVMELEKIYENEKILPRPENWGGYKLIPNSFEFWSGRPNRLHDRFLYTRVNDEWKMVRLSP